MSNRLFRATHRARAFVLPWASCDDRSGPQLLWFSGSVPRYKHGAARVIGQIEHSMRSSGTWDTLVCYRSRC